jgi:hypothetical protein
MSNQYIFSKKSKTSVVIDRSDARFEELLTKTGDFLRFVSDKAKTDFANLNLSEVSSITIQKGSYILKTENWALYLFDDGSVIFVDPKNKKDFLIKKETGNTYIYLS